MPCTSCGGSAAPSNRSTVNRISPAQNVRSSAPAISDDELIEIEYLHPNHGQHQVVGAATKQFYGYHAGGDRFLVRQADIAAQPHYFRAINLKVTAAAHGGVAAPPTPQPVSAQAQAMEERIPNTSPTTVDIGMTTSPAVEQELQKPKAVAVPKPTSGDLLAEAKFEVPKEAIDENQIIDLEKIRGVTPPIQLQMEAAGLVTPRAIMDSGLAGLQQLNGVAEIRSKIILDHVAQLVGYKAEK